jgi:hypothetical protein
MQRVDSAQDRIQWASLSTVINKNYDTVKTEISLPAE